MRRLQYLSTFSQPKLHHHHYESTSPREFLRSRQTAFSICSNGFQMIEACWHSHITCAVTSRGAELVDTTSATSTSTSTSSGGMRLTRDVALKEARSLVTVDSSVLEVVTGNVQQINIYPVNTKTHRLPIMPPIHSSIAMRKECLLPLHQARQSQKI